MNFEEQNYLNLLKHILENGSAKTDRTGVGTLSVFGTNLRFSLENNKLPLITTRKIFLKGAIEELLFFLCGETNTKKLEEKGVNIWKGNTSRDFLDKRGLANLPEGDFGKMYGYQWRSWGKDENNPGIDQLKNTIDRIKNDPNSRRHVISAWNVSQLHEGALEPCHCFMQFYVDNGTLSLQWYQRSVDLGIGFVINVASYGLLTHIIAKSCNLKAKELVFCGGDTHIYNNIIDQIKLQLSREPYDFPTIDINKQLSSIQDIENLKYEDFMLKDYKYHPPIKMIMSI